METKIKRLQVAVVVLFVLFIISVSTSIYSAIQIKTLTNSIPSYKDIKEDIKALNEIYKISETKVPEAYEYTKEKAIEGYEYGKEKTSKLINYIKDKTE